MEVNKQDDYSLTIPLLVTNGDVGKKGKEEQYTNNTATGTASFISTCFNALNALSGSFFTYFLIIIVICILKILNLFVC